jgi:tetratricopeptide (TPR) repeat protein
VTGGQQVRGREILRPTRKDFIQLARDLCRDDIRVGAEAPELAYYSVRSAVAFGYKQPTIVGCVEALLTTCVGNHLRAFQYSTHIVEGLKLVDTGKLGQLEYDSCMLIARFRETEETDEAREEAEYLYRRAEACAQKITGTRAEKLLRRAHALACAGRATYLLGDRRSGMKDVAGALLMAEAAPGRGGETAWVLPNILQMLAGLNASDGSLSKASDLQEQAVDLLRDQVHGAALAWSLKELGHYQRDSGQLLQARATLEEALQVAQTLASSDPVLAESREHLIRSDLVGVIQELGDKAEAANRLKAVLGSKGVSGR